MKLSLNPALTGRNSRNLQTPATPCSPGKFSGSLSSNVTKHSVFNQNLAKFSGGLNSGLVLNPEAKNQQPQTNRSYAQRLLSQPTQLPHQAFVQVYPQSQLKQKTTPQLLYIVV